MAVVSTGQITITDVNDYTYQGTTAPKNPIPNVTVWIDTSVSPSVMKRWTGTAWEIINEVVVGGRNLLLNSNFNQNLVNGWTSVYGTQSIQNGILIKTFSYTSVATRIEKVFTLNEIGTFTFSIYARIISGEVSLSWDFFIGLNFIRKVEVVAQNTWKVYSITFENLEAGQKTIRGYLSNINIGATVEIDWEKLERGNKATDWTPAPEDIQSQIDTESAKVINLEHKTDFLTGTTVEGNAIATGTLLVGNSDGTNAGVTGIIDRGSASVRLWAGATFAGKNTAKWLMRDDGVEEQWFNGILVRQRGVINGAYVETWYNLNGQIGKKITFSTDGKILEEWYNNGTLVYQIGQNGIYYVTELPLSWTSYAVEQISTNPLDSDATLITNIKAKLVFTDYIGTQYGDYAVINLNTTSAYFRFNAGRNIYSEQNKQYEKFYYASGANSSAPTATTPPKLANGWYCMNFQNNTEDIPTGGGWANYSFVVSVFLITSGEISETRNLTISGSRRIHE